MSVAEHYTVPDLERQILDGLRAAGKDIENLAVDDLAPVDEFHIRGRVATEELAGLAKLAAGQELLDVGCGLGGTCRYLASSFGCRAVGIDLTEVYCRIAESLSARVGLSDVTSFQQASALELPFDDGRFDVVWTEHVQMNIADKAAFYGELARVLKPGGQLAFHDIFAGPDGGLEFPVPWAADASISHLVDALSVAEILEDLGLERVHWNDRTVESAAFFTTVLGRVRDEGWMPLGLHLLMGDTAATKFENVLRNLEGDRVRVVQAVYTRPPNGTPNTER
jgi:SAM-dependent methyltransferase